MDNQFTEFQDSFNSPLKQSEYFEKKPKINTRLGLLVFHDSGNYPDSSFPVGEISETISLPLAGTLDSKYEPIGEDEISFKTITPMFEKTSTQVGVPEMKFYEKIMKQGRKFFLKKHMDKHIKTLKMYVENMKAMALTGLVYSYYKTNEGEIKGKAEYDVSSAITSVSQSTFGIDFSTGTTTRMQIFAAYEKQRKLRNKATGLFNSPEDCIILASDEQYTYLGDILDVAASDNKDVSSIERNYLKLKGYKIYNEEGAYKKPVLNKTTGKYVMTEYTAIAAKETMMIDVTNGGNKFRYLDVADFEENSTGKDYFLLMVLKADKSGADIYFRSVPLAIINGYTICKITTQA